MYVIKEITADYVLLRREAPDGYAYHHEDIISASAVQAISRRIAKSDTQN